MSSHRASNFPGPESERNERVDGTNALRRGTGPGNHEVQGELVAVKRSWDLLNFVPGPRTSGPRVWPEN